jgi:hypothetical protein
VKRVLKNLCEENGISHGDDFIMACHNCGQPFPEKAEMGMVEAHFEISHPGFRPSLDLIFIGEGEPPKARS